MNKGIDIDNVCIDDVVEMIDSEYQKDLLIIACEIISAAGNNRRIHYSPAQVCSDLFQASVFESYKDSMIDDYKR